MYKFQTNPKLCTQCGICILSCPKGLLKMEEGWPVIDSAVQSRCNNCGQCFAFCPTGAAIQDFSKDILSERSFELREGDSKRLHSFLKSRRSIRNFLPEPMSKEEISRILETANYAPSGGNNRKIRWIVLENPAKTRELSELIAEWFDTDAREHPVYSKRYAIDSILSRYRNGKDVILRGAPHVAFCVGPSNHVWGPVDTGIALAYFNLAAEAEDAGCCFAGYATKAGEAQKVREFLGVKNGETVWCALVFGKKLLHPARLPYRGEVPVTFL